MPIITPTYPHQNSAFNVTGHALKTIRSKMEKARDICRDIVEKEEEEEKEENRSVRGEGVI
jgi:poly(A) polymerase Pap1